MSRKTRRLALAALAVLAVAAGLWAAWRYVGAVLWARAQAAARAGDWRLAEEALASMDRVAALHDSGLLLRIRGALQRGDRELAVRLLERVRGTPAETAAARLERARILLELHRLRAAEAGLRDVLALQDANLPARRLLIAILGVERRVQEQEAELWNLLEHARGKREARVEALCLLARGGAVIPADILPRGGDEGTILRPSLEADAANADVAAALAYFLRNRGQLAESRRVLEPWFPRHGDSLPTADEYLALLLDEGRTDEAAPWLDPARSAPAAAAAPVSSARRSLLRGAWLQLEGRPGEAVSWFQDAIARDPRDPEPHHRLAAALRAAGKAQAAAPHLAWVEAARNLRQEASAIVYAEPDPAAVARAARLCRAMGRDREADAWQSLLEPGRLPVSSREAVR